MAKEARIGKWKPKKWKPVYENIICLNIVAGVSVEDLVKQFGYTRQHISNILNSEQADFLRELAVKRMRGGALDRADSKIATEEERLQKLHEKSLERVESVMNDEELFKERPFAVIDRGLKILSARGTIRPPEDEKGKGNTINNLTVNQQYIGDIETIRKIKTGLDKALEVREIHGVIAAESFDGK